MTIQEINKAYKRIIDSLDNMELKEAFDRIRKLMSETLCFEFQEQLDELSGNYLRMLHYRMEGVKDPMQDKIYNGLRRSSYELADQIKHKALAVESPLAYHSYRRNQNIARPNSYDRMRSLLLLHHETNNEEEYERTLIELFNTIWISGLLTPDEAHCIKGIVHDNELPSICGCMVVSALMLGSQAMFDKEKLLLLCDAFTHHDDEIRVRALISLSLTLYLYRQRTELYPEVADNLASIAELPDFTHTLRTICLRFILTRETEKITRKLQEELIPQMMKLTPKINEKLNLRNLTTDHLNEEMNPEWENMIKQSGLDKKMEEFGELQKEGADVMHSTFAHLKDFAFFREIGNWFLPFFAGHSSLAAFNSGNQKQMIETMARATFMCNSDKYSFYFSILGLPEAQRVMMTNQFDSQAAELIQQNKEELSHRHKKQEEIAGQYIQDLYRFFKSHPRRNEFHDIFAMPLDFHNLTIFKPYLYNEESLTAIVDYYFLKKYFSDALVLFSYLAEVKPDNDILFQKIGYCKQMTGDMRGAIEAYKFADLLNPQSKWVLRSIAGCLRNLKQPEEALQFYMRYDTMEPDNFSVLLNIGHCLLELKKYDEALKYYFKVDYLDNKNNKAARPIAWCSFLTGKYDQARHYYKMIIENQPNTHDYLNAGHTEWALQNVKDATSYYVKAVQMENGDFNKFKLLFEDDRADLAHAGIESTEIPLMMDQVSYSYFGK